VVVLSWVLWIYCVLGVFFLGVCRFVFFMRYVFWGFSDMMFVVGLKDLIELFLASLNFGFVLENLRKL
jgi:hypothetical protein